MPTRVTSYPQRLAKYYANFQLIISIRQQSHLFPFPSDPLLILHCCLSVSPFGNRLRNTFYRWAPAPPVSRGPPPTTAPCVPPPSAFTRKDADDAIVVTNKVIARVIMLFFSTLTSWPFNYTSTAPFAVIFVYSIGKLIRRM